MNRILKIQEWLDTYPDVDCILHEGNTMEYYLLRSNSKDFVIGNSWRPVSQTVLKSWLKQPKYIWIGFRNIIPVPNCVQVSSWVLVKVE